MSLLNDTVWLHQPELLSQLGTGTAFVELLPSSMISSSMGILDLADVPLS